MKAQDGRDEFGVGHRARPTPGALCGPGPMADPENMDCDRRTPQAGQVSGLPPDPRAANGGSETRPTRSRLWLWFVAAFVVQAIAWAAWLTIASHYKVEEIPLATQRAR